MRVGMAWEIKRNTKSYLAHDKLQSGYGNFEPWHWIRNRNGLKSLLSYMQAISAYQSNKSLVVYGMWGLNATPISSFIEYKKKSFEPIQPSLYRLSKVNSLMSAFYFKTWPIF